MQYPHRVLLSQRTVVSTGGTTASSPLRIIAGFQGYAIPLMNNHIRIQSSISIIFDALTPSTSAIVNKALSEGQYGRLGLSS